MTTTKRIHVTGVVQGVGFRPFVYGLARELNLHGWVCNTSGGVEIVIEGQVSKVERFIRGVLPLRRRHWRELIPSISRLNYPKSNIRHSTFNLH
jgi:hydrogenase maturation factor HypF (carbamoyltransferase family)